MMLSDLTCLIAQTEPSTATTTLLWIIFAACMILPWVLGWFFARSVKMPDYAVHVGLILWLLAISSFRISTGFPPKLGIDLKGGVILEYEVFPNDDGTPANLEAVVPRIENRLNASGLKEISIRAVGNSRLEVIVPDVEPSTIHSIKEMIHKAGLLEFRIVADDGKHRDVIQLAEAQAITEPLKTLVHDANGVEVGKWVGIGRESTPNGPGDYKIRDFFRHTIRDANTGKIIRFAELPPDAQNELTRAARGTSRARVDRIFERLGYPKIEILMATNDGENVRGDDLRATKTGIDEQGRPEVVFRLRANAAPRFASLTSRFKPDPSTGARYHLGIILDDELLSAPTIESTISDNGRITGNFTMDEVKTLVEILEAGTMPAKINKEPLRESQTSPLLGEDMIRKSAIAMGVASLIVLVFMIAYYRVAGVVACVAVIANLWLTIAIMIGISAALTLTGIAGMVLTVGMSVDANVLIFERMREEAAKGASIRMVIRNGFDRAFSTILDSNITTIITAVILYLIGTAQVKGFAITLVLGIAMSMFTACYASRIVFDILERIRWFRQVNFAQWIGVPKFDYVKIMVPASVVPIVLIVIGMGAFFARGRGVFDIDFNGGTSVIATLKTPMTMDEVRSRLAEEFQDVKQDNTQATFSLTGFRGVPGLEDGRVWKVDSSLLDDRELQEIIKKAFTSNGQTELVVHNLVSESFTQETVNLPGAAPATDDDDTPPADPEPEAPANEEPASETPADQPAEGGETPAGDAPTHDPPAGEEPKDPQASFSHSLGKLASRAASTALLASYLQDDGATQPTAEEPQLPDAPEAPQKPAASPSRRSPYITRATLQFSESIDGYVVREKLKAIAAELNLDLGEVTSKPIDSNSNSAVTWEVSMRCEESVARQVVAKLKEELPKEPVWASSDRITGQVAADAQKYALIALFVSLLGIIGYVWFRFEQFSYGFSAVVALVHDVFLTLAAIGVSAYVSPYMQFLLIDEFKINLPVVAALLTLVGYSLNDTIVTFDRIREIRGKSPTLTPEMINLAINQTMSRTILTFLTTFIVVVILYFFGGESIHGFAFCMVIGSVVGVYSSVFIAAPLLLWLKPKAEGASK